MCAIRNGSNRSISDLNRKRRELSDHVSNPSPCALVDHRWYHDEITSGFHMVVNIGGETYGFWDLGIIGAAGKQDDACS